MAECDHMGGVVNAKVSVNAIPPLLSSVSPFKLAAVSRLPRLPLCHLHLHRLEQDLGIQGLTGSVSALQCGHQG